jgi:hypothetical protein
MKYSIQFLNWEGKAKRGGERKKNQQRFYARAASIAYRNSNEEREKEIKRYMKGFKLDTELSNDNVAIIYNPKTKEVITSVRGTDLSNPKRRYKDLRTDALIALGVDRFLSKRTKHVKSVFKNTQAKYPSYEHTISGHSLGAKVASNISKSTGTPSVVFNKGSSPLSSNPVTNALSRMFAKDNKTIHHTTKEVDPISISAKLFDRDETKSISKKADLGAHDLENFLSEEQVGAGKSKSKKKRSKWILHVQRHQKTHGCSYGEAMKGASKSYKR